MTEAVDGILLTWYEDNYQHYCTVARVDSGTVWKARPAVRDALRDLVQKSTLAQALTLSPGRARAACVSLVGSFRPISFVERWEIVRATAKTFNVPRGHVTVTDMLSDIFLERHSDDVRQMMTVLQWFFGPEYLWFTAARLNHKSKFDALCKNYKYLPVKASEVASSAADETQFSSFRAMFRAFPCQVLQEIYERIPCSTEVQLVFRGLHYDTREKLDAHVEHIILNGFTDPESFSTRVQSAKHFVVCSSNVYAICL